MYLTYFLGTAPLLTEQNKVSGILEVAKTFCISTLNAMCTLYGKRKTGKGKIHKKPSALYGTPVVFSAQFLVPKLTATLPPGNYILKHLLTAQFFTCIK